MSTYTAILVHNLLVLRWKFVLPHYKKAVNTESRFMQLRTFGVTKPPNIRGLKALIQEMKKLRCRIRSMEDY